MKKVVLFALVAISTLGFAQSKKNKEIPKVVTEAFAKEHPNTKVTWDVESDGYEAEFKLNGKDASVNYDKKGNKLASEIEISLSEMPKKALNYIVTNFPKNKIKETAKITDANNVITFEAELKIDGKNCDLIFDALGNFIKVIKG